MNLTGDITYIINTIRDLGKSDGTTQESRGAWLAVHHLAIEGIGIGTELCRGLYNAFFKTADWMRNRDV